MELFQSKILSYLIGHQYRRQDYKANKNTNKRNCGNIISNSGCVYDAVVDNEYCDMIIALYNNDYNNINNNDNEDISIDDMIRIVRYNTNVDNNSNSKTGSDLQIQLAMLWRIITIIKKSKNSGAIINNFFESFLENIKGLPSLALSVINYIDNNENENMNSDVLNFLPYPELAYLTHYSTNSDRQKDPLALIVKIMDSVESFAMTANDDEKYNALSLSLTLAIKTGKLSFISRAMLLLLSKSNNSCKLRFNIIDDIFSITKPSVDNDFITKTSTHENITEDFDNENNDNNNNNNNNNNRSRDYIWTREFYSDCLQDLLSNFSLKFLKKEISARVSKGGLAFSFGKSDQGKLGHGDTSLNRQVPTLIETLMGASIVKVVSMSTHVLAIDEEGMVHVWGGVGLNSNVSIRTNLIPVLLDTVNLKFRVADIACGLAHSLFLTDNGRVYSKGNGGNGRLGLGDTNDRPEATLVTSIAIYNITSVTCGACNSLALTDSGLLLIWGKNSQGQCGVGHTEDLILPMLNKYLQSKRLVQLAAGWEHSIALTSDGHLYSWGCGYKDNRRGIVPPVLGLGDSEGKIVPEPVSCVDNIRLKKIASGWDHCLALDENGKVLSWGSGQNGKLGHGVEENIAVPCYISSLENVHIIFIAAGSEHSSAISETGLVYTWGHGDGGRLGHGDNNQCLLPTPSITLGMMNARPFYAHCGDKFTIVIMSPEITPSSSSAASSLDGSSISSTPELSPLDMGISNIIAQIDTLGKVSMNSPSNTVDSYFNSISNEYVDNFITSNTTAGKENLLSCKDLVHILINFLSRASLQSSSDTLRSFSVEISKDTFRYLTLILEHYLDVDNDANSDTDNVLYSVLTILEENIRYLITSYKTKSDTNDNLSNPGPATNVKVDRVVNELSKVNSICISTDNIIISSDMSNNGANINNNNNENEIDDYQMSGSRLLVNFEENSEDEIDDDNYSFDDNDEDHRNYYLSREEDDDGKEYINEIGSNTVTRPGGSNHDDDQQNLINFEFRGEVIGNRAAGRQLPGSRTGSRGTNRVVERASIGETDLILVDNQEMRDGFDELEDSHDSLEATFDFSQLDASSPQHLTDFNIRLLPDDVRRDSPNVVDLTRANANTPTSNVLPSVGNDVSNLFHGYDDGMGIINDMDILDDSIDMNVANQDSINDGDNNVDVQRAILRSMETLPQILNYNSVGSLQSIDMLKETLENLSNKLYSSADSLKAVGLWYKIQKILKVGFMLFYRDQEKKNIISNLLLNPESIMHKLPGLIWGLHTQNCIRANITVDSMLITSITFIQTQLLLCDSKDRNNMMIITIRRAYYRFLRSILAKRFNTDCIESISSNLVEIFVKTIITELHSLNDSSNNNLFLESSFTSMLLPFMMTILSGGNNMLLSEFCKSSVLLITKLNELYITASDECNMKLWLYDKMRFIVLFLSRSMGRLSNPVFALIAIINATKGIPLLLKYFNNSVNYASCIINSSYEDSDALVDTINAEINCSNGYEDLYDLIYFYTVVLRYVITSPNSNTVSIAIIKLLDMMDSNPDINLESLECIEKCLASLLGTNNKTSNDAMGGNNIMKLLLIISQQLSLTAGRLHAFNVATKAMGVRVLLPNSKLISATSPTLCTNVLTPFGDFMLGFWVHLPSTFDLDINNFNTTVNSDTNTKPSKRVHLISRISETSDTNLVSLVRGNHNTNTNPNISLILDGGFVYIEVAITLIEYTNTIPSITGFPKKKNNTVVLRSLPLILGQWHYVTIDLARSEEKKNKSTANNDESFSSQKVVYVERNIVRLYVDGSLHEQSEIIGGKSHLFQNIIIGTIPWSLGSKDPNGLQVADVCWLKTPTSSISFNDNTVADKNLMLKGFQLPLPPSVLIGTLNTILRIVITLLELLMGNFQSILSDISNKSDNSFLALVPTLCDIIVKVVYNGSDDCQLRALGLLSLLLTHTNTGTMNIDPTTNLLLSPAGSAKNMAVSLKASGSLKNIIWTLRELTKLILTPTKALTQMIKYNANTNCGDEVNIKNLLAEDDKSFFILRVIQSREDSVYSKSSNDTNIYSISINENTIINTVANCLSINNSNSYATGNNTFGDRNDFITQLMLLLSGGGLPVPDTTSNNRNISYLSEISLKSIFLVGGDGFPLDPFKVRLINELPLQWDQLKVPYVDEFIDILRSIQTNNSNNDSHANGSVVNIMAILRFMLVQYLSITDKNTRLADIIDSNMKNIISVATLDLGTIIGLGLGIDINDPNNKGHCVDIIKGILKVDDVTFLEKIALNFFTEFRYHYHNADIDDDKKSDNSFYTHRHVKSNDFSLTALAGDIHIADTKVRALSHFPSISLRYVSLKYLSGRWFYECSLLSDGLMQIGWAGSQFRCDPVCGQGVGDHLNSWAFDGLRMKKWNVSCEPYGRRWRLGDTVGVLVDMDLLEMRFYLNGEDLGCAFSNFQSSEIFPAFSLNVRQIIRVNFGQFKFLYPPDEIDGKTFRPIMDAISSSNINGKLYENDINANSNDRVDDENNDSSEDNRDDEDDNDNDDGNDYDLDNEEAAARRLIAMENEWAENEGQVNDNDEANNDGDNNDNNDNNDSLREIQLHRQSLIEALIGMGFPVDWSLRAAENTEASLSESTAIAWIIEKMEYEQNKMDDMEGDSSRVVEDEDGQMETASFDYLLRHQESNRTILSNSNTNVNSNINNIATDNANYLIDSTKGDDKNGMVSPGTKKNGSDNPDSCNKRGLDFHNYQDEYSGNVPWITDVTYPPLVTGNITGRDEAADLLTQMADLDIAEFVPVLVAVEIALCVYYARAIIISIMDCDNNVGIGSNSNLLNVLLKTASDTDLIKLMRMCFKQSMHSNASSVNNKIFPNIMAIHTNHDNIASMNCNIFYSSRLPIQPFIEPAFNPCLVVLLSKLHLRHYKGSIRSIIIQELILRNNCMQGLSALLERMINVVASNCNYPNGSIISSDFNEMESKSLRGVGIDINDSTSEIVNCRRVLLLLRDETLNVLENASSLFNENKDWILFSTTSLMEESDNSATKSEMSATNTRSAVLWAYYTLKKLISLCITNNDYHSITIITPDVLSRLLKLLIFSSMSLKYFIFDLTSNILNKLVVKIEYAKHSNMDANNSIKMLKDFYISIELERNLLQFFGLRLRTEATSRVFSIYTRAIGRFLLHWQQFRVLIDIHQCKHVTQYIISDKNTTYANDDPFFNVTQVSSNSITVSWRLSTNSSDANLCIANVTSTGLENPVLILRRLGLNGMFRIEDLNPDTLYLVSVSYDTVVTNSDIDHDMNIKTPNDKIHNHNNESGHFLYVSTEVEPSFIFDAHNISPNLVLNSNHLSLRNISNKKWSTARGTVRMVAGIHSWDVHIDRCISKNIFIGVTTDEAKLDNYVGCDKHGWAFLANKAIWHNKSKLKAYGDLFKSGDTVTITLDLDVGILSFALNGKDMGVAVENLSGPLYPAFSLYNEDDQLSIIPPKNSSKGSKNDSSNNTSGSERIINRLNCLNCILSYFFSHENHNSDDMYSEMFKRMKIWEKGVVITSTLIGNDFVSIIIDKASDFNGFFPGDVVTLDDNRTRQKKEINSNNHSHGIVIGYAHHRLWIQQETTRELLGMTSDSISQLRQKGLLSLVSKANNIISDTYSTNKGNEGGSCESIASLKHVLEKLAINWGRHDDILLIKLLETIARARDVHPTHIGINDLVEFHNANTTNGKYAPLFHNFSMLDICVRSLAIIMLNDLLYPLLKLVSPLHDTNTDMNTKDTSSLIYNLRYLIFQTVKSDYATLVSSMQSPSIVCCQYQYFSKLLNKSYYHINCQTSSHNTKTTIFIEDKHELIANKSSGNCQKMKLLADMDASYCSQFYSQLDRSNDTGSTTIGESGLRSTCTNSIFFSHPYDSDDLGSIIIRKRETTNGNSYLFQLLDEHEANISTNPLHMEKLIFDEFMTIAIAQVQEIVDIIFIPSEELHSLSFQLTATETRAVLFFFYAAGLLIGSGIRNGAPMHLCLPSIFYKIIGSISETKKVANFDCTSNNIIDNDTNVIATCALTMRLGISSVFPEAALNLLNIADIRFILKSANSILSARLLQTHAQYDGVSSTDRHIEIFWLSLRRLSKKMLLTFLRKLWRGDKLTEYVYYEMDSSNSQLPAALVIKPPTALGLLSPDDADISVFTSGNISIPRCSNVKIMMDKLSTFLKD